MKWETHFATRTGRLRRNTVREFLKYAGRPDIISFAGGLPDPGLLPVREIQAATRQVINNVGAQALQYGPSEGIPELRSWVASRFGRIGAKMENVLITSGSQQALDLLGRVLLNEGDNVIVQNPTYLAALSAWAPSGVNFHPLDHDCSIPEKLIYTIPNFRNPSGETLSIADRQTIIREATTRNTPLVEDDAYGDLRYEGAAIPSMLELHGSLNAPLIHVGTLSKVLSPGLRLGWIIAAKELIDVLVQARQAADLHTSTYAQYLALQMINDGVLNHLIPQAREVYRQKRDAMLEVQARLMPPNFTSSRPEGGLFLLLRLPSHLNGRVFAEQGLKAGVAVVPGEDFHITGGRNTIRLNFSLPSLDAIRTGMSTLAKVARELNP
jgi:2-aminoadipate transaminase